MSRALPKLHRRRILIGGLVTGTLIGGVVAVGAAMASETQTETAAGASTGAPTVSCPAVQGQLPAIPASAQAEVDRNLALLDTQIAEANTRLADTVGQGGVDFVDNAILGPLADKRASTLDRIRIAIERQGGTAPANLTALATCAVA